MRTNRGETAVHVSLCPVDLVQCVYALRQWFGVRVSLCLFYKIIISVNPNSVLTFYVYVSDQTVSYSSMTFGPLGWLPGGNIYSPHSVHGEALPERGTVRKLLRCRYDHFLAQKVWVLLWALLFLTSCKQWYFFILIVSYSYGYWQVSGITEVTEDCSEPRSVLLCQSPEASRGSTLVKRVKATNFSLGELG